MIVQTAAYALAALALQTSGPAADYVILGDETRRARLEGLLARRPASRRRLRPSPEGGMYPVGCISAWRNDPVQTEACLASRLPRQGPGTIVLNTYHPRPAQQGLTVTCHGRGGTGRADFGARPRRRDGPALEQCIEGALAAAAAAPARQRIGVRWSDRFAIEDRQQARSRAERVLLVAIDHVGVPRGTIGSCLIQGRVVRQERGSGIRPGALVEAGIPCTAQLGPDGKGRRIRMGAMREGSFARLYLSEGQGLADFEPVP